MKLTKILAVVIAAVMLVIGCVSCAEAEKKVTVTLEFKGGICSKNANLFKFPITLKVSADDENGPSVLDVLHKFQDDNDVELKFENDVTLISYAGLEKGDKEDKTYMWEFLINGESPKAGKADTNYVKDGDVITYQFIEGVTNESGKTTWKIYEEAES